MDKPIECRIIQAQTDWIQDRKFSGNHSNSNRMEMQHIQQSCLLLPAIQKKNLNIRNVSHLFFYNILFNI